MSPAQSPGRKRSGKAKPQTSRARPHGRDGKRKGRRPSRRLVAATPPDGSDAWPEPWVELRSASRHPFVFEKMVRSASPSARPGDLVAVFDRHGERFGTGLYNPRSRIVVRLLAEGDAEVDTDFFRARIEEAAVWRRRVLGALEGTDCWRVLHSEGDGLSGLVVDRYGSYLSIEVFSLGMYERVAFLAPILHEVCGTTEHVVSADPEVCRLEGIDPAKLPQPPARPVPIRESGLRFEVDFARGHKTGFFCDQRGNRRLLAELSGGLDVLDLCCYTGGFAVYARALGGASAATGVDLDEDAVAQATRNANLNQARVKWVHADAFGYARQMRDNGRQWDMVVLDPPKFVTDREARSDGRKKYYDLNRLALSLVRRGGFFVTCSCSGRLDAAEFETIVIDSARSARRQLQLLRSTGAGPDHPVAANCPQTRYLKVLWWRVT